MPRDCILSLVCMENVHLKVFVVLDNAVDFLQLFSICLAFYC